MAQEMRQQRSGTVLNASGYVTARRMATVSSKVTGRVTEVLIEETRAHLAGETTLEEVRFVLFGEPAYRLFEMVNDAAKVAAQMERLKDHVAI